VSLGQLTLGQPLGVLWRPFQPVSRRLGVLGWLAMVPLLVLLMLAVFGPALIPYDPDDQNLLLRLRGPAAAHWLGTDAFGRDVLARLSVGLRTSLTVATISTLLGLLIGTLVGCAAAYVGGWVDGVFAAALDVALVFPSLLLGMMLMIAFGPGTQQLVVAAVIVLTIRFARVARSSARALRAREFVESARAAGSPWWRIVGTDIFPNVLPYNLALSTYWFDRAINLEAGLSFLGIGIQPPRSSLGNALKEAMDRLLVAPWLVVVYAGVLVVLIVCLSLVSDALARAPRPN
jgi:peptide/nickel transport system permease protein